MNYTMNALVGSTSELAAQTSAQCAMGKHTGSGERRPQKKWPGSPTSSTTHAVAATVQDLLDWLLAEEILRRHYR